MTKATQSSIVTKCALIIDILAEARSPMVFSEIVERTGFVKSSCHRILAILLGEKLIEYDAITRTYTTGERLQNWSRWAWRRIDLQEIAFREMQKLSEKHSLNLALSVLDGDSILYLRTVDHIPLRYAASMGDHAPLHCTAAGKVFLASMSQEKRKKILEGMTFDRLTERTITTKTELLDELITTQSRGYGLAIGEEFLQVNGIAAPIRGENGEAIACLSIWKVNDPKSDVDLEDFADELAQTANKVSKVFSGSRDK